MLDRLFSATVSVSIKNTCATQMDQLARRSCCNMAMLSTKEGRGAQVSLGHTGLRTDVRLERQVTHHEHRDKALANIAATRHKQV